MRARMSGISLYSIVTKEAATVSNVQVWASVCFGAACKNYLCESLQGQNTGYGKEMCFFYKIDHCSTEEKITLRQPVGLCSSFYPLTSCNHSYTPSAFELLTSK